jgi:hypothetical protein
MDPVDHNLDGADLHLLRQVFHLKEYGGMVGKEAGIWKDPGL